MSHHRINSGLSALVLVLTAGATAPALAQSADNDVQVFDHVIIDAARTGDCKAVGDLDGDGLPDVVLGGAELRWYKAPSWTSTLIAVAQIEFSTDMQLGDIDGDGDLDIIIPDGPDRLGWFENRLPAPWVFHLIGSPGSYCHDVQVADIDGNGSLDVITGHHTAFEIWFQQAGSTWTRTAISSQAGTGLAIGDIDGDGRPDILTIDRWLHNPDWAPHIIATDQPVETSLCVANLGGDSRPDVIIAPSESSGQLKWYEQTASGWIPHTVAAVQVVHACVAVDMTGDGLLDIVFAEMAQSSQKRVGYFAATPAGGWTLRTLATTGSHNIRIADLGGDGDIDVVGSNWQGAPLEAWVNRLDPAACLSDWDHNHAIEPADVASFISDWYAGLQATSMIADFNFDGRLTPSDVAAFISAWFGENGQTCP